MRPTGKAELLSPAGDMERLEMALAYGADAVYLAGDAFGMRAFAGNFDRQGLARAVELCAETDYKMKSSPYGDRELLSELLIRLSTP